MRKDTCLKMIKKGSMTEFRQCLRKNNHSGNHIPNLMGMKIGKLLIKKLGMQGPRQTTRWIAEIDGVEKLISAQEIMAGGNRGKTFGAGYAQSGKMKPEYCAVVAHHRAIFRSREDKHRNYKGMSFCDDWNPNRGGAYWKGAKWIIDNLGEKPSSSWSIDIIKHKDGFTPGNLRWAKRFIQTRNQQHRVLGQWSEEEFAVEAYRRGYVKENNGAAL